MNRLRKYPQLVLLLLLVLAAGCSNLKRLEKGKPLRNRTPGALIKANQETNFQFEYVGLKLSADVHEDGKTTSFKANVRMKRDSIIWISISPALGVEMIRMVITPDSVKYVSKIPGDKHYYIGDFGVLSDVANTSLDFNMLQDVLVGNAVLLDKQEDKYESRVLGQRYVLISKLDRKLKKLLNTTEKDMSPDAKFDVNPLSRDYQKMRRRANEEELMLKRFWIEPINYRIERVWIEDFYNFRELEIAFDDFKEKDGQWYPQKGRLTAKDESRGNTEIRFEVNRVRLEKEYEFPFSIPEDYERRFAP